MFLRRLSLRSPYPVLVFSSVSTRFVPRGCFPLPSVFSSSPFPPPHAVAMSTSTATSSPPSNATAWVPGKFPPVRRDEDFTETFKSKTRGEVKVADPYHWLHDPDSDETKAFVKAQGEFASQYLAKFEDADKFKKALTTNWDYPKFSCPALKGDGNYYFSYNQGLQPQASVYRFSKADAGKPIEEGKPGGELFFDVSLLSEDGSVSKATSSFSDDGKYWAYALSRSGSDWTTCYVRPTSAPHSPNQPVGTDQGRLETDILRYLKFSSIGWTHDSKGFFYQRLPARSEHGKDTDDKAGTETDKDLNAMLYYHRVGTTQEHDVLVHKDDEHPEWMFSAGNTDDGRYVVLSASKDTARSNLLWIADLQESEIGSSMKWNKVINEWGTYWTDLGNDGSLFYFYTNAGDSPNYKIVTYDLEKPEQGFKDLIPHRQNALLSNAQIVAEDKLLLLYSIDVKDELWLHELKAGTKVKRIGEGLIGSIDQITGRREDREFWFSMTSFTSPGTVYRYEFDAKEGEEQSIYRAATVKGINPDDFMSEQVFYKSKDGTKIPMFVTRPADVKQDGTAPAILYGYGGFSISLGPFFSPSLLTWISHYGGVLAVANIRGGGEYGEDWHIAGIKEQKQNVFDDFQYAAKYLISENYAAKDKVAISGGSNGGLLVAACVNQAPELFGAAVADVGVLDMLRFHRFTIGRAWTSDYGCADEPEDFDYLIKYSPLHTVDATKTYPPLMLLTADHDDRVVPLHSFKLAAELQHSLPNNPNPLLLRVDTKSGHGAGKSTDKKIIEAVDRYGFVSQAMGLKWRE
ncbi:BZ3500_MvSof-1268-A1-R1_Chr2-1g04318 [Microbotryum saponariae]|uniref:Prolyl endopeptidase n=1 Tax=Microbotryum saponariae TaxID=289078 RepID=A0A2X0KEI1_9BASI|nr:BZ3500_MvSof-1268-A1-R1_Chr2-1g04318 [Microbotryum saponariae]SCZ91419.1 BZ3501_MvSof-1269-A2-R1_Chr2-1g03974 [Microbotryum saponariae]